LFFLFIETILKIIALALGNTEFYLHRLNCKG
jgi:hypothetical protein